jgi:hypothetical protein
VTEEPAASQGDSAGDDYAWRWSRDGVQRRILSMTPADALLTVEQYNGRHFRDVAAHLDTDICLAGLAPAEAADIRQRVARLRDGATAWGQKYWSRRLRELQQGLPHADDSEILAEMAARHPGFSEESLVEVYNTGIMLAR